MHIDNLSIISFTIDVAISTTNNKRAGFTPHQIGAGFTLIELLIVIAVLGILAASILIIIKPFEQFAKARDAERKKTLRELANALERYYIKKGSYPVTAGFFFSSEPEDAESNNSGDWIPGLLASNEITSWPHDPKPENSPICDGSWLRAYRYASDGGGSCYKLLSHCAPEAAEAFSPTDPFYDPIRQTWAWMVCEPPGSECCSY